MGCNFKSCCAGCCGIFAAIAIIISLVLPLWYVSIQKEEGVILLTSKGKLGMSVGLSTIVNFANLESGCTNEMAATMCELFFKAIATTESCGASCGSDGKGTVSAVYKRDEYAKGREKADETGKTKCKSGAPGLGLLALALILALASAVLAIVTAFKPMKPLKFAAVGLAGAALMFVVIGTAVAITSSNTKSICTSSDSKAQKELDDDYTKNYDSGMFFSAYLGFVALAEIIVAVVLLALAVVMHNKDSGFSQVDK